ncbi:MAG: hypothetical protein V1787_05015 [Candidatus Micrarchaeota archaeon]
MPTVDEEWMVEKLSRIQREARKRGEDVPDLSHGYIGRELRLGSRKDDKEYYRTLAAHIRLAGIRADPETALQVLEPHYSELMGRSYKESTRTSVGRNRAAMRKAITREWRALQWNIRQGKLPTEKKPQGLLARARARIRKLIRGF